MTRVFTIFPLLLLAAIFMVSCKASQSDSINPEEAKAELEQLLDDFLQGASVNDADMHDRFWAEELIYTSSSGARMGKEDIMSGLESGSSDSDESGPEYGYEDLQILLFEETAVVAFQLVSREGAGDDEIRTTYYNTGTFVYRNEQWRAVAWQATRIP